MCIRDSLSPVWTRPPALLDLSPPEAPSSCSSSVAGCCVFSHMPPRGLSSAPRRLRMTAELHKKFPKRLPSKSSRGSQESPKKGSGAS
eukprot:8616494-Pyramimonas_sp.AAC.1